MAKKIQLGKKADPVERIVKDKMQEAETGEKEETIRFNFDVPVSLHKRFKLKCIENDTKMTAVMLQAIKDYLK